MYFDFALEAEQNMAKHHQRRTSLNVGWWNMRTLVESEGRTGIPLHATIVSAYAPTHRST